MTTLAMIFTAVIFCMIIGIPLGIAASRSNIFETILRPILDIMQTIPSFVYLIPVVMLFGVGLTPGVVATIIFALPPIIRLTNLGIRQVGKGFKEAGASLGLSKFKILHRIELPLALKTIMAGVNQTLMLALSMVVSSNWSWWIRAYSLRGSRTFRYWCCCYRWYWNRNISNSFRQNNSKNSSSRKYKN